MGEERKKGAGGGSSCSLGAPKKPATKHKRKRRRLATAVVEYLTSDSYMYAPLLDALPLDDASSCSPLGASPTTDVYQFPLHCKAPHHWKSTIHYAARKISLFHDSSISGTEHR